MKDPIPDTWARSLFYISAYITPLVLLSMMFQNFYDNHPQMALDKQRGRKRKFVEMVSDTTGIYR